MARSISIISNKRVKKAVKTAFLIFSFIYFPIIFSSTVASAQNRLFKFSPTAGITWRSTVMNFFNFNGVIPDDFTKPYDYERNVQGFSLNPGIQIEYKNIGFEYYANLRYDVVYFKFGSNEEYEKDFLLDHNFNIFINSKIQYGIGLSIINSGKGYEFVNPIPRFHNIEFKTYNAFLTVPIKKILYLEIKALYIPKDFPENPEEKYIMYSLRVYYKFDFLNKALKKS